MHSINLTHHWTREERHGVVQFRRSFGSPRLTDPGEAVWLCGTATGSGVLWVNGNELLSFAAGMRFEAEIGELLTPRNEALLVMDSGGELIWAAMEIRSTK